MGWWVGGLVGWWVGGLLVDKTTPKQPQRKTGKGERPGFFWDCVEGIFFFIGYGPWMVFENCCWLDRFRKFLGLINFGLLMFVYVQMFAETKSLRNLRC